MVRSSAARRPHSPATIYPAQATLSHASNHNLSEEQP